MREKPRSLVRARKKIKKSRGEGSDRIWRAKGLGLDTNCAFGAVQIMSVSIGSRLPGRMIRKNITWGSKPCLWYIQNYCKQMSPCRPATQKTVSFWGTNRIHAGNSFLLFPDEARQAGMPAFEQILHIHRHWSFSYRRSEARSSISNQWDLAYGAARIHFAVAEHILFLLRLASKKNSISSAHG